MFKRCRYHLPASFALLCALTAPLPGEKPLDSTINLSHGTDAFRTISIPGPHASAHLGIRSAGLGDIDGDGFDDFGLSYFVERDGERIEICRVFYGGLQPGDRHADIESGQGEGNAINVTGAGDVDGDGLMEFVSSHFADTPGVSNEEGIMRVLDGEGSRERSAAYAALTGSKLGEYLGYATSPVGDFDSDGYADLVFSIPGSSPGDLYKAGAASVLYGGESLGSAATEVFDVEPWRLGVWEGESERDHLGLSIAGAGDLNGDGYDDVLAGAWFADAPRDLYNVGECRLIWGGERAQGRFGRIRLRQAERHQSTLINGSKADARFGFSIGGIGDFNGDGFGDFVAGAPHAGDPAAGGDQRPGEAWIIHGDVKFLQLFNTMGVETIPERFTIRLRGSRPGNFTGFCVSPAGDVNSDGFADILISEPNSGEDGNFGQKRRGAVWLVYGGAEFPGRDLELPQILEGRAIKFTSDSPNGMLGYSAAHVGDVNGDGASDFVVCAPFASFDGARFAGQSWLVLGNPSMESATYSIRHKTGSAPLKAAGGFPASIWGAHARCAIAFAAGAGPTGGASLTEVVRDSPLEWRIKSDRNNWESATIRLQLTMEEAQLVGKNPVVTVSSSGGGHEGSIEAAFDKEKRMVTFKTDRLGSFKVSAGD